jgi:predicted alpha-1,2-mannosidase
MRKSTAVTLAALLLAGVAPFCIPSPVKAEAGAVSDPSAYVDPFIGTGQNGHVFPGATTPFGMVQLSPSNDRDGWNWTSGYHYSDSVIKGFAHTHISGAGLSALGDILLMPARQGATQAGVSDGTVTGYRSAFSHAREVATPGYYRVHLDTPDVEAELTASPRAGFLRYHFNGSAPQFIILDPTHGVGDHTLETSIEILSDREVRGWKHAVSQSSGDRKVYFHASFSRPFTAQVTAADQPVAGKSATGPAIKAALAFDPAGGADVEVAVAISHTSLAGASANFQAEAAGKGFDAALAEAKALWRERLGRIAIDDVPAVKKRIFYTAAYHAAIAPSLISDVTGDYYAGGQVRHSRIPQFSNYSSWDTYRALHPLLTIIDTRKTGEMVASMVSRHADAGMLLPAWEAVGHDNRVMIGYAITSPIADAVLKDIPGIDKQAAYQAIRASAFDLTKHSNVYDGNGMAGYLAYGFVPADVASSVSKTTEQNYQDWVIGQVAAKLGRREDAALFATRATGYRLLFDAKTGYLLPRLADGRFAPLDTNRWDSLNRHYVSGNIWAYSTYTPQDMQAAIRLHGGRQGYARFLDRIFTDETPVEGEQHVDISGFVGKYGHGDEPGHHMPYLYNLTGQPWKTQQYVNRVLREMYADRPDGIVNNEDLGQMSAWYLFSALGFYPVTPGDLTYQLGAPYQPRASIRLENGKRFTVIADNLSDRNIYVQSVRLNGKPYPNSFIRHEQIMAGGELRFAMGPDPNPAFAAKPEQTSLGAFDDKAPVVAAPPVPWAPYDPADGAYFAESRSVELASLNDQGLQMRYTLDGSLPGPQSTLYQGPIRLTGDSDLKAVVLGGAKQSAVFEKRYFRTITAGLAPGYPRIRLDQDKVPYGKADGSMLIDQVQGTQFYGDKKWTGRTGDITANIDLGTAKQAKTVSLGALDDPMNGIMLPRRVEVWAGADAATLTLRGAVDVPPAPAIRQQVERVQVPVSGDAAPLYQIRIFSHGDMPPTLSAPGRPAWLFVDEIILQ